jgi:hypothetical protein
LFAVSAWRARRLWRWWTSRAEAVRRAKRAGQLVVAASSLVS